MSKNKKDTAQSKLSLLMLACIVGLAFILRVWNLGNLPYALHDDELMNGYIGRFILQNGYDVQGNYFPLVYFNNFGDYPNVWPMYLSGVFTYLFGATAFAVRLPIALIGCASVLLIYFFSRWLFKKTSIAYLAALFMAVSPWHIILSRATAEGITASFVFILGAFLLCRAIESPKISWQLPVSFVVLLSTYFLYPSFRVITPLFLLPTFLLTNSKKMRVILIGATIITLLVTLGISKTEWGTGRYNQVSIMKHNGTITGRSLNYSLAMGSGRVLEARIFNSKYVLATREFLRQYASYFSPQFLTGEGYIQPKRYNVFEQGTAYWVFLVAMGAAIALQFAKPIAVTTIFKSERQRFFVLLIWLFLLAPIPSSLTLEEVPNIHRTVVMTFGWALLFALSAHLVLSAQLHTYWKTIAGTVLAAMLIAETMYFWHTYSTLEYESSFIYRDDSKKKLSEWLTNHGSEYDRIFVPNTGNLFLNHLFYTNNFDSKFIGAFGLGFSIDHIDNIYPAENTCIAANSYFLLNPNKKVASVGKENCQIVQFDHVETIQYKNLTDAYIITQPHEATESGSLQ